MVVKAQAAQFAWLAEDRLVKRAMQKGLLGNYFLLESDVGVTEGKDKERYGIFDNLLLNALPVLFKAYNILL